MNNTEAYIDHPDFLKYYQISLSGLMSNLTIQEIYQIASNSPQKPDLKELIVKAALNLTYEAIQQLEEFVGSEESLNIEDMTDEEKLEVFYDPIQEHGSH